MRNSEEIACSPDVAARRLGIGRSKLFEAIKAGELAAKKCGRRTLILDADLRRYADNLPSATQRPSVSASA
ncbi:MAG TPA: excisionase family DNA-binding protein [Methylocystis sp.]|jgi:excisionase family DNA binding protein